MSIETTAKVNALNATVGAIMTGLSDDRKEELTKAVNESVVMVYTKLLDIMDTGVNFDNWYEMFKSGNTENPLFVEPEFEGVRTEINEIMALDKTELQDYYETEALEWMPTDKLGQAAMRAFIIPRLEYAKKRLAELK